MVSKKIETKQELADRLIQWGITKSKETSLMMAETLISSKDFSDDDILKTNLLIGLFFESYEKEKYKKAIEYLDKIDKENKCFISANYMWRGHIYKDLEEYDEAIRYYNKFLQTEPNSYIVLYNKSFCYNQLEKFDEEKACYDEIMRINPEDLGFLEELSKGISSEEHYPKLYKYLKKRIFELKIKERRNIKTNSGLLVQSEGEKKIADFLHKHYISFDYDEQITLEGKESDKRGHTKSWIRPDFYLTEFDIIIEYWGLEGTPDYDERMQEKKRLYKEAGKRFISIGQNDLKDLDNMLKVKLKRIGCNID